MRAPDGTNIEIPSVTLHVPVPWAHLGVAVGGSIAAVVITVGIGLLFLKSSTSIEELRTA
jgi:hypothetical protein